MKLYSAVGATLTQGAFRLGAHMGQLHVSHPDVREFIHCKDGDDTLQNFNISVQIPDAFMKAVEDDAKWPLVNPRNGEVVQTVSAKELWREICESAWKTGDPGVVFMDGRHPDLQPVRDRRHAGVHRRGACPHSRAGGPHAHAHAGQQVRGGLLLRYQGLAERA
jgi:hypothetical protein